MTRLADQVPVPATVTDGRGSGCVIVEHAGNSLCHFDSGYPQNVLDNELLGYGEERIIHGFEPQVALNFTRYFPGLALVENRRTDELQIVIGELRETMVC